MSGPARMGFEYSISHPDRLVRLVGTGPLNFETCTATIREMDAILAGAMGFGVLADLRGAEYDASIAEIRDFAAMVTEPATLRGHRYAIVVSSTVMFGLGRMFSTYLGLLGGEAEVFREMEPAVAWLNQSGTL